MILFEILSVFPTFSNRQSLHKIKVVMFRFATIVLIHSNRQKYFRRKLLHGSFLCSFASLKETNL